MRVIAIALLGVLLAACGGGNGSSAPETGTFTLGITDATIDDYQEALLEVSSITLIGSGGQETSLLDTPQTIDLLKLRNVSEVLLRKSLTVRTISKIRLGVESITLNKLDMYDGSIMESVTPPVPTRKIDLNPQGTLQIRAGEDLLVMLDVDLKNSIKVHETGNGQIRFRPLVKLTVGVSGLVRLYGTYTDDGNGWSICQLERVSDADGMYEVLDMCVALDTSSASYFGSDANPLVEGEPQNSGDLADGDKVSVYGYYQQTSTGDVLAAEIIARGLAMRGDAFTTLNGIAASNWDPVTRRYDLALADNDGIPANDVIPVELSDGAKVFDLEGDSVVPAGIVAGQRTEARGALTDSGDAEPDWLQAFVVFVTGMEDTNDVIGGTVEDVDLAGGIITLIGPPDSTCVVTDADTEFFDIVTGGDITDTSEITLADILDGNTIEASGDRVGDCIQADTVIREASGP